MARAATKAVWTDTKIINQLESGTSWSGSNLTYAFATPSSSSWVTWGETISSALTTAQKTAATTAIGLWDDLIAPNFSLSANAATADVKYANFYDASQSRYAYTYYPGGSSESGAVWLNSWYGSASGTNNLTTPTIGAWGFDAIVHETGHALGLEHPGNYNGGNPTYAANAAYTHDSQQYTVMSYFSAANTGCDWWADNGVWYQAQTPMIDDVMAIQAIYGADTTTRATATTYGFNSTAAGTVYDFVANPHPVLCIYDAGGNDTLDLSGWNWSSTIDLRPGSFSSADMMTNDISIARNTWIENAVGGGGADSLTGNSLDNHLEGGAGNDLLVGLEGNDLLDGGTGNDIMQGGTGNDTYIVDAIRDQAIEGISAGTDTVLASVSYTLAANVENLTLTGSAAVNGIGNALANVLTGNDAANVLTGGAGNDTLIGGGGNDTLDGGAGTDVLRGGTGDDAYIVDAVGDQVIEDASAGIDTVRSSVTCTLGANVENLTLIGTMAISGTGNELANVLTGNVAANVLTGGDGDDTLIGGGGNDTFLGGAGNDTLIGGSGVDRLDGGAGNDTMQGGLGNDVYVVDSASDTIIETASGGTDTVYSSITFNLSTYLENLVLTGLSAISGTGNDAANYIQGNDAANTLVGGAGSDVLVGGGGNDVLIGGGGTDTLTGGAGSDAFRFLSVSDRGDTILDFVPGADRIEISASGFGGGLQAGGIAPLVTAANPGTVTHAGTNGYFILDNAGAGVGTLYWDATGGAATDAVSVALVRGTTSLGASDLVLV